MGKRYDDPEARNILSISTYQDASIYEDALCTNLCLKQFWGFLFVFFYAW